MTQIHTAAARPLDVQGEQPPAAAALQLVAQPVQLTPAEEAAIAALQAASSAPNTRRAYTSALRSFRVWCKQRDATALPADPQTLCAYLRARVEVDRLNVRSLAPALTAIRNAHAKAGLDDPTRDPAVRDTIAGLRRTYGEQPKQAAPLTAPSFAAIAAVAHRPRQLGKRRNRAGAPVFETEAAAARRGDVDLALIATLRSALLRRAEVAALQWRDLTTEADGSGRLTIRRSKTDQTGEGALRYLPPAAVSLLAAIRSPEAADDDSIFGLSPSQIGRRVKAAAAAAGLGDGYTAHSGRVGMTTDLLANGATIGAIQLAGDWSSPRMPAYYARSIEAGNGAVAQYVAQTGSL